VFVSTKPFQPYSKLAGKARSLEGAPLRQALALIRTLDYGGKACQGQTLAYLVNYDC